MCEQRVFPRRLAWVLTAAAVVSAAHARGVDPSAVPNRYLGNGVDAGLVKVTSPDGRTWSAWSYRSGSESDIAISVRDALGTWSEPVLLGAADGRREVEPALAFDAAGNLYVAHGVRETGEILVSRLAAGNTRMSSPVLVSVPGERGASPTLMLTDSYLIVGYRVGARVRLRAISLLAAQQPFGVQDGPDGFPPTQNEGADEEEEETTGIGL